MGTTLNTSAGLTLFVTGITCIAFYPTFFGIQTINQTIYGACTVIGIVCGISGNLSILRTSYRPTRVCSSILLLFAMLAYIISAIFAILEHYGVSHDESAHLGFSVATWIAAILCALFQGSTAVLAAMTTRSQRECAYCSNSTYSASRRKAVLHKRVRRRMPKSRAHIRSGA